MALTFSPGPLARQPGPANYTIDGPRNRILLSPTEKRVRVVVGDGAGRRETVVDTTSAVLLHETGLLPRYYVPTSDVRTDLTAPSDTVTHCPYKGDASYWSLEAGGHTAENAVWSYEDPIPGMTAIAGYLAFYRDRMDGWSEEDTLPD